MDCPYKNHAPCQKLPYCSCICPADCKPKPKPDAEKPLFDRPVMMVLIFVVASISIYVIQSPNINFCNSNKSNICPENRLIIKKKH